MLRNTVALLLIEKNGAPHVVHIDLDAPAAPYVPQIDWDAGFQVAGNQFAKSILASELIPAVHFMRANFTRDDILALRPLLAAKAIPIWERQGGELTIADVEDALLNDNTLSLEMRERVQKVWHAWQNSR
jgi:hypothetical protein